MPTLNSHWVCHAALYSQTPATTPRVICDWDGCPLRGEVDDPHNQCFLAPTAPQDGDLYSEDALD